MTHLVAAPDDALLVARLVPGVGHTGLLVQDGVIEGVGFTLEKFLSIFVFLSKMTIGPPVLIVKLFFRQTKKMYRNLLDSDEASVRCEI